jgi:hypothetical protein
MKFAVYFEVEKNRVGCVAAVTDNITLALDSETPLLIRSHIIPLGYAFSLRVSLLSEDKGDTLCLSQSYPN